MTNTALTRTAAALPGDVLDLEAVAVESPWGSVRPLVRLGAVTAVALILGFIAWAATAPLKSATSAAGAIEVAGSHKTIQHLEDGIIGQILVRNGDHVAAGQPLIRLDTTKAAADLGELKVEMADAEARHARLLAERDGLDAVAFPPAMLAATDRVVAGAVAGQREIFATRRALLASKINAIEAQIEQTRHQIEGLQAKLAADKRGLELITEESASVKKLLDKGLARRPYWLQLERQRAALEGEIGDIGSQIAKANESIAEAGIRIANLKSDDQKDVAVQITETQQKMHTLRERIEAAQNVLARTDIVAPEDGVVTDLQVHTTGGVVRRGEKLMDLVPDHDEKLAVVRLLPADIENVHAGEHALIRLTAYKTRRYPEIDGEVIFVSPDRLTDPQTHQDYFVAKIRLDKDELAHMPEIRLIPGMQAQASIETGRSTVALMALQPIFDSFHRAFRED